MRNGAIIGFVLALAACQSTVTETAPARPLPAEAIEATYKFNEFMMPAIMIAEDCPAYRIDPQAEQTAIAIMTNRMIELGVSDTEFKQLSDSRQMRQQIQRVILGYLSERDIYIDDEASFCRAGAYETRRGSAIGRMLRAVR